MKVLSESNFQAISGGEILPGFPTPETLCSNVKLLVAATRNEPGFDITAAVGALMKNCSSDFWEMGSAHEYAMSGSIGVPVPPPIP